VNAREFAHPPGADRSFGAFLDALPDVLVARDFRAVVDAIVAAAAKHRGVIVMLGGHVVKTGLAPLLVDLMARRVITHVAMNGSAAIHDYEMARFGATSEDVAAGLRDGTFGMAEETGREMNAAFTSGMQASQGMGETLGRALAARSDLVNPELSILLGAFRLGVPTTVHAALGAEIIHQHPSANGAAIGDTSHRDFRRLAASCIDLDDGGVVLNLGSAVIMPEVFVKALSVAHNLGHSLDGLVTVNLDKQAQYRSRVNVLERPSSEGIELIGHHEILLPLLHLSVACQLARRQPVEAAAREAAHAA